MRARGGVALIAWLLVAPGVGRAQGVDGDSQSALSWVRLPGAEACLTAPQLAARVEERLDRVAFTTPGEADLSIEGRVEAIGGRYRAHVVVADRDGAMLGQRVVEADGGDCSQLADRVTLIVALTIRSSGTLVPLPEQLVADAGSDPAALLLAELEHEGARSTTPDTDPTEDLPTEPAAATARRSRRALDSERPPAHPRSPGTHSAGRTFGLGMLSSLGGLPTLGYGPLVVVRLPLAGAWVMDLRGAYQLSPTVQSQGSAVEIAKVYAALSLWSPEERLGAFRLSAGAGALLGATLISQSMPDGNDDRDASQLVLAAELGSRVRLPLGQRFGIVLEAGVVLTPWPTTVVLGSTELHRDSAVSGRLALLLDTRF